MRILVIEDNPCLSEAIAACLAGQGAEVSVAHSGGEALRAVEKAAFDLLILDLGLPDMDGLGVLQRLRQRRNAVPVLVLSARDGMSDRIKGFNCGADDYMTKPFSPEELLEKVRTLTDRASAGGVVVVNDLSFDPANRLTKVRDVAVSLSEPETEVLEQLLLRRGRLVPARALQHRLNAAPVPASRDAVDALVGLLRDKLQTHDAKIEIHTLKGIGYMLAAAQGKTFQ